MQTKRVFSKIFSLALAAVNIFSAAYVPTAFADSEAGQSMASLWGNYPEHPTTLTAPLVTNNTAVDGVVGDSPAQNLFKIGGREFILLDKDSDGNYFVIANEDYGQSSEITVASDTNLEDQTAEYWGFNPKNSGSLAYKINDEKNGLLCGSVNGALGYSDTYTGDKSKKVIPSEMLDDLIEYEWDIEPFYPDSSGDSQWITDNTAKTENGARTVKAKLSYMSYTEYMTYKDKIGLKYYDTADKKAGIYLRTPYGYLSVGRFYTEYTLGNMKLRLNDSANGIEVCASDAKTDTNNFVRPVMWLKADFFKNNKIDLQTAGSNVLDELRAYDEEELYESYTEDEVFDLFGKTKEWDWGHYPTHSQERTELVKNGTTLTSPKHADSPAENLFTIGGRRFIMLDRNAKGEYFVMADEEYGQLRPIVTESTTNDYWEQTPGYTWRFDPSVSGSAAAILNDEAGILSGKEDGAIGWKNGTYTGDTSARRVIPAEMTDDILEKEWEIEPFYTHTGISASSSKYSVYEEYRDRQYADSGNDYTTVKAKLAFLSWTELMTYKDKIGYKEYISTHVYAGTMLRSYTSYVVESTAANASKSGLQFTVGPLCIKINSTSDSDTNTKTQVANANEAALYVVRPVMWLKEGFFANNKIDIDSAGSTVLTEMRTAYDPVDYLDKYSVDEINKIYKTTDESPKIDNAVLGGTPTVGGKLFADYRYTSPTSSNEGETEIYWLSADTQDGEYRFTGVTGDSMELTDDYKGKFIKYGIMPVDISGNTGSLYLSEASAAVSEDKNAIVVEAAAESADKLSLSLKNLSAKTVNATVVTVEYSDGGKTVAGAPKTYSISISGGAAESVKVDYGSNISVIVLNEDGKPIYSKVGFVDDTSDVEYKPYRTDVNPVSGTVTITGKNTDALINKLVYLTVTKTDSSDNSVTTYYSATKRTNTGGEYIFVFNMPQGSVSDMYEISFAVADGNIVSDSFYWISASDSTALLNEINGAASDTAVKSLLGKNSNVFLGNEKWWTIMDSDAQTAVAKQVYGGKTYATLDDVKTVVYNSTALNIFGCCDSASEISDVLEHFSDIYGISAENSICCEIYDKMSEADKEFAFAAMASDSSTATKESIIGAFDRGVLFAAISRASDANTIKEYLDNTVYRSLITGFDNYGDYNSQTLAKHLYAYGDIKNVNEFLTAVAKCKKSNENSSSSSSGSSSGGSSGGGSGIYTDAPKDSVTTPVNNEEEKFVFDDMAEFEWATEAVDYLAEKGYVNGVGDGNFAPGNDVTRAEYVKMLTAVLDIEADAENGSEMNFADMPKEHWAYNAVYAAYCAEITVGIGDDMFGTDQKITRQDMAVIAYRALKASKELSGDELIFTDSDDISDYAKAAIGALNPAGVINGFPDGSFKPFDTATRAQAAQIMYNIITKL